MRASRVLLAFAVLMFATSMTYVHAGQSTVTDTDGDGFEDEYVQWPRVGESPVRAVPSTPRSPLALTLAAPPSTAHTSAFYLATQPGYSWGGLGVDAAAFASEWEDAARPAP